MAIASTTAPADRDGTMRLLTIMGAAFAGLTTIVYCYTLSITAPIPRDGSTLVVGRDFLNFWMYGRSAWLPDPSRFYDPRLYNDALTALFGAPYPGQNWSYPPSIMLLAAPFGRVGYLLALLCWTVLGLGLFVFIARRCLGDARTLIPILCSPAAVFCLISGQSAFVTVALMLGVFFCLDRRPLLAGVLIGLLTLKPQLGLLFPVMLAASGRWRTFAAAGATAGAIVALTAAVFGSQVWIDFVVNGIPAQNLVLADPELIATRFFPTIFMNVRGTGASYTTSMAIQALFSIFAVGAVAVAFRLRKNGDPQLLTALFFACTVAGLPYLLSYDTLGITALAVVLLASGKLDGTGTIVAKLVYWLPLIQMVFGQYHIPGPALIAPALAAVLLMQLLRAANDRDTWRERSAASAAISTAP